MFEPQRYTILIGGISGDAHSVGLILLRQAIQFAGYQVAYLGTQNGIKQIIEVAAAADVALVSCMDGHAHHYLKMFPEYREVSCPNTLWYLGGNPSVLPASRAEREFLSMGFDRVYLGYVDASDVLEAIAQDLSTRDPIKPGAGAPKIPQNRRAFATCTDERLSELDYHFQRREVLRQWSTGHQAEDMNANAAYLVQRPSLARLQHQKRISVREPLIQPRCGVADDEQQLLLFLQLQEHGADVLSYQIDSLTRNNNYAAAATAIAESKLSRQSTLNGFPLVNYGVPALRRIAASVTTPLQCRHSTRDPRLLAELCYAGGVSGFEGGPICYNLPYYKDYPLPESLSVWRYVDRLTGLYQEKYNIAIDREFFGVLTATLIPPSLAIAVCILEAALAVRQGVCSVSIGYAEQGNRAQDIAAIRSIPALTRRFFEEINAKKVQINSVYHQYMSAFPEEPEKARSLIAASATTGALAGASRVLIKTAVEAIRIPTLADNLESIDLVRRGHALAPYVKFDQTQVAAEMAQIEEEVMCLLDAVLVLGRGDLARGIVEAFRTGALDVPFSPSIHNAGRVVTARDEGGAVRFVDCGGLPLSSTSKQFHSERIQARRRRDGIPQRLSYRLVEDDVLALPRGRMDQWPLA